MALTMSDDGYLGLQSVSFLNFTDKPFEHTETILNKFPMGKLKMPENSTESNCFYKDKRLTLSYEIIPNTNGNGRLHPLTIGRKD